MKKIIVSVIAVLLVVCMGCTVFASNADEDLGAFLNDLRKDENANINGNGNVEQIQEGNVNTNKNTNTNTNVNENRPATTPHAGLEDYTGLIFVAVFAVSAIYAYKKVKEYNA